MSFPLLPADGQNAIVNSILYQYSTSTHAWTRSIQPTVFTATTELRISSLTDSVSTSTGALIVAGGAGIGKNLFVGGQVYAYGPVYSQGWAVTTSTGGTVLATPLIAGAVFGNTTGTSQNVSLGFKSLKNSGAGQDNIAIGYAASENNGGGKGNTAIGRSALINNVIGEDNIAVGACSLMNNSLGHNNIALGNKTLINNSIGNNNIAIGLYAINTITNGGSNIALGVCALQAVNTGSNNIAIGDSSLANAIEASDNIAIGYQSLYCNVSGIQNTGIGQQTLYGNTGGNYNTALGYKTLYNLTGCSCCSDSYGTYGAGWNNIAVGHCALFGDATYGNCASGNIGIGVCALAATRYGDCNIAIGYKSMINNTCGYHNTALGSCTLYGNTTGRHNVAVGEYSLQSNSLGSFNTAIGWNALRANTEGCGNISFGNAALNCNTFGNFNIGIGYGSLSSNISGCHNIALGTNALYGNSTYGSYVYGNIAIGCNALFIMQCGYNNVAIGTDSLYCNVCGLNNVAIGKGALHENTNGTNNVAIGPFAGYYGNNTETIAIGNSAGYCCQNNWAVAVGTGAGSRCQSVGAVAMGYEAGAYCQGLCTVSIGKSAATYGQCEASVAIGNGAGYTNQQCFAVALGYQSGLGTQGAYGIAIGWNSGLTSQGAAGIAIGQSAGRCCQSGSAVSVGPGAGCICQGISSVAIGDYAADTCQGNYSIAIGPTAGEICQGTCSIAIGMNAGITHQGVGAIAIGTYASQYNQGNYSVAIGTSAGYGHQNTSSIIINATGAELNSYTTGTYIAPIRGDATSSATIWSVYYNPNSKEITTSTNSAVFAGGVVSNTTTFLSTVTIANVSNAVSTTTGALIVNGGVSVAKDLWIGGALNVNRVNILNYDPNIWYVSDNIGEDIVATYAGHVSSAPFKTIKFALSQADVGDTIFIDPGTYTEEFPLTIPRGVSVRGAGLREVYVQPTTATNTATAFLLNGETTISDFTVGGFYKPGYAFRFAPGAKTTTRSPYIERFSVITRGSVTSSSDPYGFDQGDAGNGAYIDGAVLDPTSIQIAMLFNESTFIVPNATGIYMTNGARTEFLNGFVYFADKAINAVSDTAGFGGAGKVKLKLSGVTGTFTPGDTLYYKSNAGTILATATIGSVVGSYIYINRYATGFQTAADAGTSTQIVYSTGASAATATSIVLADYHQFGAEMRSIGSAAVFGNSGVTANGTGTDLKLIAFNMSHIGSGKDLSDDVSLTVQTNEIIQLNGGKIYYQTVDHSGDFRVGDHFLVNQRTGDVTFNSATINLSNLSSLEITNGIDTTLLTPGNVVAGSLTMGGGTFGSQSGNITITPAGGTTILSTNAQVNGILSVTNASSATSTTTGALRVTGGVGIGGALFVGAKSFVNGAEIVTTATLAELTYSYKPAYITQNPALVPESGTITTYGTYNFGTLTDVTIYGDYNTVAQTGYYSVNDAATTPAFVVYAGWNNVTTFNRATLNINYTTASGHTVDIDLYNYQTSAWDTFGVYSGSGNWQQFALGLIDHQPYVSNTGTVALRIYHVSTGNTAHRTWIDYLALEQSTIGGQGPRGTTGATGPTGPTGAQGLTTSTTSTFIFYNTQSSTSTATGSVTVLGGVGIAENLYVGQGIFTKGWAVSTGTINSSTLITQAVSAINLTGGLPGYIPIQSASGTTAFIGTGSVGFVLQMQTNNTATWVSTSSLGISGGGTTFTGGTVPNATTFTNTVTILSTLASTSTITGALVVAGGVGIGGQLSAVSINSNYYTTYPAGSNAALVLDPDGVGPVVFTTATPVIVYSTGSSISTSTGALTIAGGLGVAGNIYAGGQVYAQGWAVSTSTNPGATLITETTVVTNTTTFTVSGGYTSGLLQVIANGIQLHNTDYTATDGSTVVTKRARQVGDTLRFISLTSGVSVSTSTYALSSQEVIIGSNGQTVIPIPGGYNTGTVQVYLNGILLNTADFTATNGTSVVLSSGTGVLVGHILKVISYNTLNVSGALPLSGGTINGSLTVSGVSQGTILQTGVYATTTARDAAITSPVAGMIVLVTSGTGGTPRFTGYTGAAWVDFN